MPRTYTLAVNFDHLPPEQARHRWGDFEHLVNSLLKEKFADGRATFTNVTFEKE